MKRIYIVPDGGMGNRMRAIASGIHLAQETHRKPIIVWHTDALCNAPIDEIFCTENIPAEILQPTEISYHILYEQPRRKNLFIPRLITPVRFYRRYYDITNLMYFCEHCDELKQQILSGDDKDILIFSGQEYYDFPRELYRKIFKLRPEITERAHQILDNNKEPKYALQIRRTDHDLAINSSPVELFIEKANELAPEKFFLATDDDNIKSKFKEEFNHRVITNQATASRSTKQGIIDAMAEIHIMSKTEIIYGSYGSSFPEIASWLGNNKLSVLSGKR